MIGCDADTETYPFFDAQPKAFLHILTIGVAEINSTGLTHHRTKIKIRVKSIFRTTDHEMQPRFGIFFPPSSEVSPLSCFPLPISLDAILIKLAE